MKKIRIDFYLTDSIDYLSSEHSVEHIKQKLADHFQSYSMGFSINNQIGGYVNNDGKLVLEKSIKISIIGFYAKKQISEFVSAFKEIFNQESVLVCCQEIDTNYY